MSQLQQSYGTRDTVVVTMAQERTPVSLQGSDIRTCSEQGQPCCPSAPSGADADRYPSLNPGLGRFYIVFKLACHHDLGSISLVLALQRTFFPWQALVTFLVGRDHEDRPCSRTEPSMKTASTSPSPHGTTCGRQCKSCLREIN